MYAPKRAQNGSKCSENSESKGNIILSLLCFDNCKMDDNTFNCECNSDEEIEFGADATGDIDFDKVDPTCAGCAQLKLACYQLWSMLTEAEDEIDELEHEQQHPEEYAIEDQPGEEQWLQSVAPQPQAPVSNVSENYLIESSGAPSIGSLGAWH